MSSVKLYAGIGSRETPLDVLNLMERLGKYLASLGVVLRSGGASGADTAFSNGCNLINPELQEIWLPWNGFNGLHSRFVTDNNPNSPAMKLAAEMHPAWGLCSQGAKKLHARNGHQILGADLNNPVNLVICWTAGGRGQGGTGQAIRIAKRFNIPVCDLGAYNTIEEASIGVYAYIKKYIVNS